MKFDIQSLDLKKIIFISVGVFVILLAILFFLGSNNKTSETTVKAQQLVSSGKEEEALNYLIKNKKSITDNEGAALLNKLQSAYFAAYATEAQEAVKNKDYILAYEKYQRLLPLVTDKNKDTVQKNLRELEKIVTEIKNLQTAYNDYMKTFSTTLKDSNQILVDYKLNLDKAEMGTIKPKVFAKKVQKKMKDSNKILNDLDAALQINNPGLLSIHKEVINMANKQHNLLLAALVYPKSDKQSRLISNYKKTYLDIKETQIELIQNLNTFATKNNLSVININETGEQEVEVNEEAESTESVEGEIDLTESVESSDATK